MKPFEEIFSKTEVFLNSKGVNPEIFRANRTTESLVKSFEKRFHLSLPENFSEFYLNFSDGYSFIWENGEEVGGGLIIPSLDQLAVNHQRWQKNVRDFLDDPRSLDGCVAPEFRASAFEVWTQMLSWLPIGTSQNFCLTGHDSPSARQLVFGGEVWQVRYREMGG
jgi:hypothetical protein